MIDHQNQLHLSLEERKFHYQFLHTLFSSPLTKATLEGWKDAENQRVIQSYEYFIPFLNELTTCEIDEVIKKEEEAFQNLFFGPGHIPAPPWESVYRTRDKVLFGEPALKFREKLREFNLQFDQENEMPEDHIAIELEFMVYLIDTSIIALSENNQSLFNKSINYQTLVLHDHLIHWVIPFTKDITSFTTSSLYKGASQLIRDFVLEDSKYLKQIEEVLEHA